METILKKAEEGGWNQKEWIGSGVGFSNSFFMDQQFWKALSKSCGWKEAEKINHSTSNGECGRCGKYADPEDECPIPNYPEWKTKAYQFHEINLNESFIKAVEYLESLVSNK